MNPASIRPASALSGPELPALLRGEAATVNAGVECWDGARVLRWSVVIIAGTALFGAAMGSWRDPLQALYTAIKLPLVLLLTTLGTAMLNAMFAPLLGVNIGFRQSLLAVWMSFTIAATILGGFSPVLAFLVWNLPALETQPSAHGVLLLSETAMIACAGLAANLRLVQLLRRFSGSERAARRVLVAWLAANLLLGAQLSWNLRPFVGSPGLPVEFLRPDPFHSNFFEALFRVAKSLLSQ